MGLFSGSSSTKVIDTVPADVRELYSQLSNWLSPQIGMSGPVYGEQMYAGASPLQNMAFQNAGDMFGNLTSGISQAQNMGNQAIGSLMQPFDTQAAQDYWKQSFVNPGMNQWNDIQRSIMERFAGSDATRSGALNRSLSRAGSEFATNLTGQLGNIMYSGQQDYLNRLQNVPQMASMMSALPQQGINALSSIANLGGVQQGIDQNQLNEAYQKWQMGQAYNNPYITNLMPMALQQPGYDVVSTQSPGIMSALAPALGGFLGSETGSGMLGDALGGMWSGLTGLF